MMQLVDSCGWIAWLTDDLRAQHYAVPLADPANVIVPTMVLAEVARWVQRERGEAFALSVAAAMQQCPVVPLDAAIALLAAELGLRHRLAMADAVIYAHAQTLQVPLLTSDGHFAGLDGVQLL